MKMITFAAITLAAGTVALPTTPASAVPPTLPVHGPIGGNWGPSGGNPGPTSSHGSVNPGGPMQPAPNSGATGSVHCDCLRVVGSTTVSCC
jgi:hypothetical protein